MCGSIIVNYRKLLAVLILIVLIPIYESTEANDHWVIDGHANTCDDMYRIVNSYFLNRTLEYEQAMRNAFNNNDKEQFGIIFRKQQEFNTRRDAIWENIILKEVGPWCDRNVKACANGMSLRMQQNGTWEAKCTSPGEKNQALWAGYAEGQSTPDMDNILYPFDIYGVSWNHSNPQSATTRAVNECKEQGGYNCGVGRGPFGGTFTFSSSADEGSGEFLKERCIRVILWSNPILSGLNTLHVSFGDGMSHEFFRDQKVLSDNVYCNDR